MSGPGDGEEFGREVRERRPESADQRALNQEAAAGLISVIGPCDGGRIFHALLAAQEADGEPTKLLDCLVKEAGPEPPSYSAACSSRHSGVWTEAMQAEIDGLEAAGTFTDNFPEGSNIVDSNWLLKWKGDQHRMIDRVKARSAAKGYSQVEEVDYSDAFPLLHQPGLTDS